MAATIDNNARLLVTGASGPIAQFVLEYLLDTLHVSPVTVSGSRSVEKLAELADRGVTTCRLDFNDPASVEAAAQGVDRPLFISGDDIFHRMDEHRAAVTALVAAGVRLESIKPVLAML